MHLTNVVSCLDYVNRMKYHFGYAWLSVISMHFNNEIYHYGYVCTGTKDDCPIHSQNDISFCSNGPGKKRNKIAFVKCMGQSSFINVKKNLFI